MNRREVILTGIKPTGSPHLGNYIGAIRPALELARRSPEAHAMYFLADYHALTLVKDPVRFRDLCHELAATWIACGLDPERQVFYRQSDVPEVFELSWILSCSTSKGLMNRAHAYKAQVDRHTRVHTRVAGAVDVWDADAGDADARAADAGNGDARAADAVAKDGDARDTDTGGADAGVNMGLYSYPILMAADILLFQAKYVPVGRDQEQHIEIARDIAARFNRSFGDVLTLPLNLSDPSTAEIPGTDGRKMSKAYNNTIPLFGSREQLLRAIFGIKTDSSPPGAPKDPGTSLVFQIYRQFADGDRTETMRSRLVEGRITWKAAKEELFDLIDGLLERPRAVYEELMADRSRIDRLLEAGACTARELARPTMETVRQAVGR
ncbi:MAG: tryptophan--tRNA ligase [Gemmatimonadetes bacterium]|nr:tryptophan--tRNA ligase [Gemmatimonadota bacterium]MYG84991.1 tryptophan--tRNA ligase [Gemmatimonadota bacterium]MYJ90467.1 tryptophan--tRNA ligase [Gemmatimonadota bacterium]